MQWLGFPIFPGREILVLLPLVGNQLVLDIVPYLEDGIESITLPCFALERQRQDKYVLAG